MFGYIRPVEGELLVKDSELYRAVYCGLCKYGGKHTSVLTRFFLNYDFVLLSLLRIALTGEKAEAVRSFCPYAPKKHSMLYAPQAYEYTLKCFSILAYYNNEDDISDSKGIKKLAAYLIKPLLKGIKNKAGDFYDFESTVTKSLSELSRLESDKCGDIDAVADKFAVILAKAASYGIEGEKKEIAYRCGYHLGRFIYIADAVDDLKDDSKNGSYNPLLCLYGDAENAEKHLGMAVQTAYDSMMAFSATYGLGEKTPYDRIIYNICELGSAEALKRVAPKETIN